MTNKTGCSEHQTEKPSVGGRDTDIGTSINYLVDRSLYENTTWFKVPSRRVTPGEPCVCGDYPGGACDGCGYIIREHAKNKKA